MTFFSLLIHKTQQRVLQEFKGEKAMGKDMSGPKVWNFIFLLSAKGAAALESFLKKLFLFF